MEINWIEAIKIYTSVFILFLITDYLKQAFLKNKQPKAVKELFSFLSLAINAVSALFATLVYTIISIL